LIYPRDGETHDWGEGRRRPRNSMSVLARLKRRKSLVASEGEISPPTAPAATEIASAAASADLSDRVRESLDLLEADLRELIAKVGRAAEQVHTGIASSTITLDAART